MIPPSRVQRSNLEYILIHYNNIHEPDRLTFYEHSCASFCLKTFSQLSSPSPLHCGHLLKNFDWDKNLADKAEGRYSKYVTFHLQSSAQISHLVMSLKTLQRRADQSDTSLIKIKQRESPLEHRQPQHTHSDNLGPNLGSNLGQNSWKVVYLDHLTPNPYIVYGLVH